MRTIKNPLHLTDLKAKELKEQPARAARALKQDPRRIPFIKPAVFLHDPDLVSGLDEFQRTGVYGRDGGGSGLPGIWDGLLSLPPERESRRVTPQTSLLLEELMKRIGVSHSTTHLRFGDDWRLEPRALDAGPGWEDRLAQRDDGLVQENGRVRIYLAGEAASQHQRHQVDRAARREYHVLQGINHRGIVQAVQIQEHVSGPAILFRHRTSDLRLDAYLDAYGGRLTPEARLDLVRQLAEAVRYAHNRSLYHRALSARSVYVSAREDGSEPVLRIADWQTAARDFKTTMHHTLGDTPLDADLIADVAQVYLAPETDQEFADPVDLDVFGLGSLAYLLLASRRPPGRGRSGGGARGRAGVGGDSGRAAHSAGGQASHETPPRCRTGHAPAARRRAAGAVAGPVGHRARPGHHPDHRFPASAGRDRTVVGPGVAASRPGRDGDDPVQPGQDHDGRGTGRRSARPARSG
ncbi:protein kinase domain-containing protein [Streptomyces prasinus]|uniref:protein kinase domain-containing protein n=1 Tax=Streptomyces prasinus TaxID=67345 RepID=UPI0033B71CB8